MTVKEFYEEKVKPRVKKGVEKTKEVTKIVAETFKKNPMVAVSVLSSVCSVVTAVSSNAAKSKEEEKERCTTYDSYAGANLTTKHELTNAEILEMTARMKEGQKKVEALNDMGLLKEEKRR